MNIHRFAKNFLLLISLILVCLTACGPNIEELRENEDIDALIEILADDDRNYNNKNRKIRASSDAAKALGELGDKKAVRPLIDALLDTEVEVRSAALEALLQINDPAYQVELDILKELNSSDKRSYQFIFVKRLQSNDYNAYNALISIITDNHIPDNINSDEEDKEWARDTLIDLGVDTLLIYAASEDEIVSENAWQAISAMGSDMVPLLKDVLSGDNEPFKLEVADFLIDEFREFIHDPEMGRMCEGNPIPEATAFNKEESGPHPFFICPELLRNEELPLVWRPFSFEEVELIVFIDELDPLLIETCDYYDNVSKQFSFSKLRYQRQFSVELHEAQSGEMISSSTLMGPMPAICKEWDYEGDIYGDYLSSNELQHWLEEQGVDF